MPRLRYLLLQTRNIGDPMAAQEVRCFARMLDCDSTDIDVFDLLSGAPSRVTLQHADMLLLGGSGHYSAACESAWLERTLDSLREVHRLSKPTFASCWGFQAMARAMGGRCVNDLPNAELGTVELRLTDAGSGDLVFNSLPSTFAAQAGHEDHVVQLPPDAVLLASSSRVKEQAFRFLGRPIYCTQFHPELDRAAMLERVVAYPDYVTRIARISFDDFVRNVRETPEANGLLRRFVSVVFGK
ncbi:MAG TPA: type 1 glutamine amidotransferase [Lacipirellulaceae bacterium]|nr:type 1 glutamine amidotransferase [Lacipirellulaceae bacterium]